MNVLFSHYSLAASVATDLVNTSALVRRSTGDALTTPLAVSDFLTKHGLEIDALTGNRQPDENDVAQLQPLRDEIRTILEAATTGEVIDGATGLVARGAHVPTLLRDDDGELQWGVTTSPRATLAEQLAVLAGVGLLGALRALGHGRFRHCASPECDGVFVDTSKAGRRRYCMPDVCGNRLNVARHRARQRQSALQSPSRHERPAG